MRKSFFELPDFAIPAPILAWKGVLVARLERTTIRERFLLGGLAVIGLVLALLSALSFRAEQEDRLVEAAANLASARLSADSARRIQRASLDEAALRDLDEWGFKGSNLAVVRVRIEERLTAAAAAANLTNVTVLAADVLETDGPTSWLSVEVSADLMWTPLFGLLDEVGSWTEGFRVLEFSYEGYQPPAPTVVSPEGLIIQAGPPARLALTLSFPVVLPPEAAGS